jgi:integration host factor subunit beta
MVKSELVEQLAARSGDLDGTDIDRAVCVVLQAIGKALANGQRVELRGFGSFYVKERPARMGRNPRTGAPVSVNVKRRISFRIGKEMHVRLNARPL